MSLNDIQANLSQLPEADQKQLAQFVAQESQKAQIQDNIHQLTERCFKKCITSTIRSGKLDSSEESCMQNCVGRFMDSNIAVVRHLEKMRTTTLG